MRNRIATFDDNYEQGEPEHDLLEDLLALYETRFPRLKIMVVELPPRPCDAGLQ